MNIEELRKDIEKAIENVIKDYDYDYADLFGEEIDIHTHNNTIITITLNITEETESEINYNEIVEDFKNGNISFKELISYIGVDLLDADKEDIKNM